MSHIDWKNSGIPCEAISLPRVEKQLAFRLEDGQKSEFASALEEAVLVGRRELRLELPGNWTLFWKIREGESRFLLAHPEPDTWVATLALEEEFAKKLVSRLKTLMMGERLVLGEIGKVASGSNLEIVVSVG